jgi:hypothetical protein
MYSIKEEAYDEKLGKFIVEEQAFQWNAWRKASILFAEIITTLEDNDNVQIGYASINYNDEILISFTKDYEQCVWWFNKYEPIRCEQFYDAYTRQKSRNAEAA